MMSLAGQDCFYVILNLIWSFFLCFNCIEPQCCAGHAMFQRPASPEQKNTLALTPDGHWGGRLYIEYSLYFARNYFNVLF